jgi:hypothetical protein
MSDLSMKLRSLLLAAGLACTMPAAIAEESFEGALHRASAAHSALYSFADLYRLAVAGAVSGLVYPPTGDAPMRTAVTQAAPQFAISDAREPNLGLLLASGAALALWVARRRLGHAF